MQRDTPLSPAPPELRQVTPPPEIRLAKETLDQIDLYDKHAKPAKDYYEKALKRLTQGRSLSGPSNGAANATPVDPRLRRPG